MGWVHVPGQHRPAAIPADRTLVPFALSHHGDRMAALVAECLTMCLSHEDLVAEPVVLWAYGRSIYDGRSAPTVRSDATRSSWLSKLHERKEKPIERTSRARSGAGR